MTKHFEDEAYNEYIRKQAERFDIIANMLKQADREHLTVEVIDTMLESLGTFSNEELAKACNNGLGEWIK